MTPFSILLAITLAIFGKVGIDGTVGTDWAIKVTVIMIITKESTMPLLWRVLNLVVAKKIMKIQEEQIVEYRNVMQKLRILMLKYPALIV
jgi:hypothetical protein